MKKQFTTPVSMKVTEQQFKNDLETPLKEMGYRIMNLHSYDDTLCNNINGVLGDIQLTKWGNNSEFSRYGIEPYNPKLFLALAGMTNSPDGNVGEWWKCVGVDSSAFLNGKLYKQINKSIGLNWAFEDRREEKNGRNPSNKENFIKATKEEIISFFSETEVEQELIGYRFRNEEYNDMAYALEYKEYSLFALNTLGFHIHKEWGIVEKLKQRNLLETFCEPVYAQKETPISYEEAIKKLNENSKVKYTKKA